IELRAQVLFRLVKLPRRHHHRVFNRRHHDLRLDVLLAAQHFDLLVQQIRHISSLNSPRVLAFKFNAQLPPTPSLRDLCALGALCVNSFFRFFCQLLTVDCQLLQNSTTKFAFRIASIGSSTVRASFPFSCMRTFPSANPARRPSKNFASPTGSLVEIFAKRPRKRSKSAGFFSARSSPGELTSSVYPAGPGIRSSTSRITLNCWLTRSQSEWLIFAT